MLGVLIFDTLPGLFIGIAMSLLLLLYRASRPYTATLGRVPGSDQYGDIRRHPENRRPDGVHPVVLDAETIPFVDVTAAKMLDELAGDLRRRGVTLLVARDIGEVRDILGEAASDPALQRVYPSVQAAVEAAQKLAVEPRR